MKKITLIFLFLLTTGYASEKVYIDIPYFSIGGSKFAPDSLHFYAEVNHNMTDTMFDTLTDADTLYIDSMYLDSRDSDLVRMKMVVYDDSVYSSDSGVYWWTVRGFSLYHAIGTPSGANVCRVFDYACDLSGNPVAGSYLVATIDGFPNTKDTCSNTSIVKEATGPRSDTTGLVYVDVIISRCLSKTNRYKITLYYGNQSLPKQVWKDTIPDLDSLNLSE